MISARHRVLKRAAVALAGTALSAGMILGITGQQRADAATGTSPGYWLVASDGGVYQFGTTNYGSMRGTPLTKPVVGGAATSSGLGYWLVASDGGVFSFGDATFYGSTGSTHLNKPIVGMAATPTGNGYWLVAADGGIFTFGDAKYYGSTGSTHLNEPIVGIAATPSGNGYWLVAADGGIFTFGYAKYYGSTGSVHLNKPIVGMAATPSGAGYWLVATDGGMFTFGDAKYLGSTGAHPGPAPIVGMIATSHGYPFPPGSTGYDVSWPQCASGSQAGPMPPPSQVSIVGISGAINSHGNPCYASETAWAGPNLSVYIFMNGLPSPAPQESLTGPAGTCNGNVSCESYNFGWYWARYWVHDSQIQNINPSLWWLDVEAGSRSGWTSQTSNAQVIAGAVAGIRSEGIQPGIYSNAYQWGVITGNNVNFSGIPLWVPGAGNISGGTYSAQSFCNGTSSWQYAPFAGGNIVLVQYGYQGNGYTGPASSYDQDYAC